MGNGTSEHHGKASANLVVGPKEDLGFQASHCDASRSTIHGLITVLSRNLSETLKSPIDLNSQCLTFKL